ncbi:MAG: acyl dehydratase [Halioglobus sp.]|nr:acyl dehydratase [Halioglobus sp.]
MTPASEPLHLYFDDLVLGEEHAAGTYEVTREAIIEFASEWDPQPFHIDEAAAKASIFGGLTACSAHIFSIFCITAQRWQSGAVQVAVAGLGFDETRMHRPVFAGDFLSCFSIVHALRDSGSRPECGIVTYRTELRNQDGEVVFSTLATSMMARRQ